MGHKCDEFIPPALNVGPHMAPLGMKFYTGNNFPAEYHEQHLPGRARRLEPAHPYRRADHAHSDGCQWRARHAGAFAWGWIKDNKYWGRPDDIAISPDGRVHAGSRRSGRCDLPHLVRRQVTFAAVSLTLARRTTCSGEATFPQKSRERIPGSCDLSLVRRDDDHAVSAHCDRSRRRSRGRQDEGRRGRLLRLPWRRRHRHRQRSRARQERAQPRRPSPTCTCSFSSSSSARAAKERTHERDGRLAERRRRPRYRRVFRLAAARQYAAAGGCGAR